jgi:hypothetical protein
MLDSYRDLIDSLLPTPTTLREALGTPVPADLSPEVSRKLHEMAVREAVNLRRMQATLTREPLMLLAIEDEKEIRALDEPDWQGYSPEADLASFSHDRSELISVLVNLTLRDWERPIDHDRSGDTTIADEIDAHLTWDEEMTAVIAG